VNRSGDIGDDEASSEANGHTRGGKPNDCVASERAPAGNENESATMCMFF
jgi:hypothetical protein